MNYLLIKQSDAKIFKAFMSGTEIEVGVVIPSKSNSFGTGDEIEIFYGENPDTYRARITHQDKLVKAVDGEERSIVKLGLRKYQ